MEGSKRILKKPVRNRRETFQSNLNNGRLKKANAAMFESRIAKFQSNLNNGRLKKLNNFFRFISIKRFQSNLNNGRLKKNLIVGQEGANAPVSIQLK